MSSRDKSGFDVFVVYFDGPDPVILKRKKKFVISHSVIEWFHRYSTTIQYIYIFLDKKFMSFSLKISTWFIWF